MRFRLSFLGALIWSLISTSVVAQTTSDPNGAIGIHWSGFRNAPQPVGPCFVPLNSVKEQPDLDRCLPPIPSPYSYHALGVFCKAEVKLNRLLPIPVMVRLGDVQRTQELDGKGNVLLTK